MALLSRWMVMMDRQLMNIVLILRTAKIVEGTSDDAPAQGRRRTRTWGHGAAFFII